MADRAEHPHSTRLPGLKKLRGLSPRENYTDRATAAKLVANLWVEGATWCDGFLRLYSRLFRPAVTVIARR
jgi:hypothetical protein